MQHISTWVETLLSTKLWSHAGFSSERESGPPGWRKRVAACRSGRRRHRFKKDKAISSIARVNLNGVSIKSIESGAKRIHWDPMGCKRSKGIQRIPEGSKGIQGDPNGSTGFQGDTTGIKPLPRPSKPDSDLVGLNLTNRQSYFCNTHNQNFDSKPGGYKVCAGSL